MSLATYRCTCGKELRFKQDLTKEPGGIYPTWKCKYCGTELPQQTAEKLKHQHPS
ncbi:MAG: hypothetical protein SVG88_05660 [Halobacteriales archaeon]|nr:hypothetical protein [Halobacteriales archaeon]